MNVIVASWTDFSQVLRVLSHPARLRIVEVLLAEERDVASLRRALGAEGSVVSQHLATLRAHRLVEQRRAGRRIIYRLTSARLGAWLVAGSQLAGATHPLHAPEGRDPHDVVHQASG